MSEITRLHEINLRSGPISSVHWSPDGKWIAASTMSGSAVIVEMETQRIVRKLEDRGKAMTAAAWHQSSEYLMTGSADGSGVVWDVTTAEKSEFTLEGHHSAVHTIQMTKEGAYIVTCSQDRFRALDGQCLLPGWTEEMEAHFNEQTGFAAAACSNNMTFLAAIAGQEGSMLLLASLLSAEVVGSARMAAPVRSLAWSPSEELLAVGVDHSVQLVRANQEGFEGEAVELTSDASGTQTLVFSPDGTMLSFRDNRGLHFWRVDARKWIAMYPEQFPNPEKREFVRGLDFHPANPLLATVGSEGTEINILDLSKLT